MSKVRQFMALLVGAVCCTAAAAWEPEDDITLVVAYKAGTATDTCARLLAEEAQKRLKHKVVVKNVPGDDGMTGWTELTKAKPDGLTIGYINLPTFTTLANEPGAPFKVTDLKPLVNHVTQTAVVVVRADSKFKSLDELVQAARDSGNLRVSTNGYRASNHIAVELFARSAAFKYERLDRDGTADQLKALLDGRVDFSCAKSSDVKELLKSKKLRVLGVFSHERMKNYPEVPSLSELGYYDMWWGTMRGLAAPAQVDAGVVDFYDALFKEVLTDPKVIAAHDKLGLHIDYRDHQEFLMTVAAQSRLSKEVLALLFREEIKDN
ncbi:MAG: tripartite tricarboxylate transporter substrate binding protein [Succinivibrio sp.]|nr:tripartite tricarboxylate transporter substrate binding protein [Succinivibrio sp.]